MSFVPYIGLVIAMIPPTLLALAEFGWVQALIVIIGVTAINLLSMPITVLLLLVSTHTEGTLWLAKIIGNESADTQPEKAKLPT